MATATKKKKNIRRPVMVMNRAWQAINVISAKRALTQVVKGNALIIHPEPTGEYPQYTWEDWSLMRPEPGEEFIQLPDYTIRIPRAITLLNFNDLPNAKVTFSRRNVLKRDRYTCQYCGVQPGTEELTLDHVVPRAQGGISSWTNSVAACVACNRKKADRTPEQAKMRLKREPVRPEWKPYYATGELHTNTWDAFMSDLYWTIPLHP